MILIVEVQFKVGIIRSLMRYHVACLGAGGVFGICGEDRQHGRLQYYPWFPISIILFFFQSQCFRVWEPFNWVFRCSRGQRSSLQCASNWNLSLQTSALPCRRSRWALFHCAECFRTCHICISIDGFAKFGNISV